MHQLDINTSATVPSAITRTDSLLPLSRAETSCTSVCSTLWHRKNINLGLGLTQGGPQGYGLAINTGTYIITKGSWWIVTPRRAPALFPVHPNAAHPFSLRKGFFNSSTGGHTTPPLKHPAALNTTKQTITRACVEIPGCFYFISSFLKKSKRYLTVSFTEVTVWDGLRQE